MKKIIDPDESEQFEKWKKLHDAYLTKYGPFFESIVDKGDAIGDALISPNLLVQVKKGISEAYNLLMETKKRLNKSNNSKIVEHYENFISEFTKTIDSLNELFILAVRNLNP